MQIPGFKVVRLIAEGGMATVYLAIQESLGRFVALKLLKKFDNPEQSNRFFNEGRIIASLNHQNIITIHDIGVFGDQNYISMEYLEGGDLKSRIKQGIEPQTAVDLVEGIGSCLDFVHKKGIIHRDIKPGNIIFRNDDTPVLTDFGIAKQLEQDHNLTMDGTAIGSPYYLSPEQAECRPLDGRTDIYGLGIVFFEMLMGHKPYRGKSYIEIVMAHKTEPIPSLPPHLQHYQGLLERMIAKDPEDRFRSAREMLKFLRKLDPADTIEIATETEAGSILEAKDTDAGESQVGTAIRVGEPGRPAGSSASTERNEDNLSDPLPSQSGSERLSYKLRWPIMAMVLFLIAGSIWITYQFQDDFHFGSDRGQVVKTERHDTLRGPAQGQRPAGGITQQDNASSNGAQAKAPAKAVRPSKADIQKALLLKRKREIQGFLAKAKAALDANKLTTPARSSAYYYYQQVIMRSPRNKVALRGLSQIANRYAFMAEKELQHQDLEKAKVYIQRGRKAEQENPKLSEIAEKIARIENTNRKVAEYLAAADRALQSARLTKPPRDNAYHFYRQVLKLSPGNKEAKRGITKVANRYADLAEREINEYRYARAKEFVNLGLGVQPKNRRLTDLRTRTNAVEDVPRRFFGKIKSIFD